MKTVLVTGAEGFIGKNLTVELQNEEVEVLKFTKQDSIEQLKDFIKKADFVFHLAGINRPKDISEFNEGNVNFTETLLSILKKENKKVPVLLSSSIQAELDNPYGTSKREAENLVRKYGQETDTKVFIYRLPNVFGKWCRPNYNSVVATFCYNISRDLPIKVNDSNVVMKLVYIDDVIREFINALKGKANNIYEYYCEVPVVYTVKLGKIVELIESFKKSREDLSVPNLSDSFIKALYSTYLSYLPENQFSYGLKMNVDHRGSFTEILKTLDRGQVSVNISKPGITKGNHWHHTKNEKFLVVSGRGVIRFRKLNSNDVIEYYVSEEKLEVVDIPPGYTHNIENLGDKDMVTIMWANEPFDPENPDTYFLEV
ncbi:capsular polysaccharide biosynthesis protein CapF [Caldifermentibacillus hisashii]|uniref:capsular polysaccharide biosynthesis protein CapF n=1 Tax=Caldifermentibacillus hisashii TaxID=996558 RepID=UPI001C10CB7F|nr:capsular polysaccharide biosynthesis protein CapF [Caldifermentibacillus hisashii]MBU5343515.1 capsular polysaccharide biosynthesis protein CapF [Caldifermentibacillus hisashii]